MQGRVIIVEDERELGELIQLYLREEGVEAALCPSAEEGLALLRRQGAELVVLDINLPGMDGFEFLQALRRESSVPVIIVSAREADEDIVLGLGIGADEFVTKPFTPRVLVARVRAMMRRGRALRPRTLAFGDFLMDLEGYSLSREGQRVTLSTKEFEVLRHLARNPGKTMKPDEIYQDVWGQVYGDLTAVAVYIRRIRRKIEEDPANPRYIQTIQGYGYRFNPDLIRA